MANLLLVDDEREILEVLNETLSLHGYNCLTAGSGQEALTLLEKNEVDLILTDISMPEMSGIELLKEVSRRWPGVLRIVMTGMADKDTTIEAINQGHIHAYFEKPWDNKTLLSKIHTLLEQKHQVDQENLSASRYIDLARIERRQALDILNNFTESASDGVVMVDDTGRVTYWNNAAEGIFGYRRDEILGELLHDRIYRKQPGEEFNLAYAQFRSTGQGRMVNERVELTAMHKDGHEIPVELTIKSMKLNDRWNGLGIVRDCTTMKRIERERVEHAEQYRRALFQTIRAFAKTVETRDPYTAGHQIRVSQLATAIARDMQLSDEQITGIELSSTIHDIGKINIPSEILNRPGKLTTAEFELIKAHPEAGFNIVREIESPWPLAEMIRQHHERLDGSGYPRGLRGDDILLEAQIIAVADVIEAISSHRPYRASMGMEYALEEINKHKNNLFNAQVVERCVELFESGRFSFEQLE